MFSFLSRFAAPAIFAAFRASLADYSNSGSKFTKYLDPIEYEKSPGYVEGDLS
jgi:hypothetical protein